MGRSASVQVCMSISLEGCGRFLYFKVFAVNIDTPEVAGFLSCL